MSAHAAQQSLPIGHNLSECQRAVSAASDYRTDEAEDFRQLRHLTKNALQRILATITQHPGLCSTHAGRVLSQDLQQQILAAAMLSDALFGFAKHPESLRERLVEVSDGLLAMLGEEDATIGVAVCIQCATSPALDNLLVRIAHELVGNAIKHGMHQRLLGEIRIEVTQEAGRTILIVTDDGWGPEHDTEDGQGLSIVDALLRPQGGRCQLQRTRHLTVARAEIPQ